MKYDWLLFDADNTLWDFNAAEASALERTLAATGITWNARVLADYRTINHQSWSDYEAGILPKSQLRTDRFRRLLEAYQLEHPAEELSVTYRGYLAASTHMLEGAVELLDLLKSRYRLGLITNGLKEVQRPRLANTDLEKFFEFIVISDEIGAAKPSSDFFDVAYRRMEGVAKDRVLVIGDNPNADVGGALAYGFDACWLRHPGIPDRRKLGETHRIRNIKDLAPILEVELV